MTKKLLVKQGGGAASEIDYATAFTGRKGAPFLDQNTPILQMGQRFANGECAQGYFRVVDPDAELSSTGFRLRPWSEVRLTDDASGDELTLAWMRLSSGDVGRRDVYIGGDEIEHSPGLMDCNLDLRGIPFRTGWDRPAETDQQRFAALKTRKLDGADSTGAISRETTDINISTVASGHLCDFSSPTDLPVAHYPAGTEVLDVVADIAQQSGKIFGIVLHHTGGSTHKCLMYVDQDDLTTYTSDVRISDDVADWDPDDNTAPTFEPHWVQGSGKEVNYEPVVSAIIGIYNGSDDDDHTVYVETGEAPEDWETFVGVFNDDKSKNLTPATRRATWQLEDRKRPFISNRVSIIVRADQAHLVEAGMALETKSVVLNSGPDKATFVWRRVAQKTIEPLPDGRYWLHLQLERPRMSHGASSGPGQPKGTTPTPAPQCDTTTGTTTVVDWDWTAGVNPSYVDAFAGGAPANPWGSGVSNVFGSSGDSSQTNNNSYSARFAVTPGETLSVSWKNAKYGAGSPTTSSFRVRFFTSDGTTIVSNVDQTLATGVASNNHGGYANWETGTGDYLVPATAAYARVAQNTWSLLFTQHLTIVVAGDPPENDDHCVDYGDTPAESPHYVPSDWVIAKFEEVQDRLDQLPATVQDFITWKEPVRVATTASGTLATAFENGDTVDGVTLATGDRILLKDQSTGAERGIYVVQASGAPLRAEDMTDSSQVLGAVVLVTEGTTNADKVYVCTTNAPITLDTTTLTFTELGGSPSGAAGGDLSGTYPNPSVVDDSHNHTSATVGGVGEILISDTPSTPLVFADLIQNEAQDDLVYADF